MKRGAWIALGFAGLAVGACTYPEFEFRSEGQGGAGAGGGGTGAGGAGGGGGGIVSNAIVPCDDAMITCELGQGCCFDLVMPYEDFCGASGNCGESYSSLRCNSVLDCSGTDVCCGNLNGAMTLFIGTTCKSECVAPERTVCDPDPLITDQCPLSCVASLYGGYGYCSDT